MLKGKGVWAYRLPELDRALQIAPQMGATHLLYKVGHGGRYYPGMADVARRISGAGLVPIAWMWLLLDDPQAEAQVVVRAFQDGFKGMVFDTESSRCRNRFQEAAQLGQYIQVAGLDLDRLYNCSFPNISQHRDLPYDQMNEFCKGGLMPMSYGAFFPPNSTLHPEQQARRVIDEWTYGHYEYWCRRWGYCPPLYPVLGPYHDEHGNVRMSPSEFQIWLDRLETHKPSFFSVFTAAVINDDLLPLIKAFPISEPAPPPPVVKVQVVSPEVGYLNVRPLPSTARPPIDKVNDGDILGSLESQEETAAKVGRHGQWLHIRTPGGVEGYVAAWYVRLMLEKAPAPVLVDVVSPAVGYLNIRPGPSTERPPVTRADDGDVLESLESQAETEAKVGRNRWLHVRTPEGIEGYAFASYLRLHEKAIPAGPTEHLEVHSSVGLNIRPEPGTDRPPIWHVEDGTVLEVLEDKSEAEGKVGYDRWIKVRTPSRHEGYVNGLYVQVKTLADKRLPVEDSTLPKGESAWIFGIHAADYGTPADFRYLFQPKGKQGWVLFTEAIGDNPAGIGEHDYSSWSEGGFGVIVRLNNGYEPAGTLPVHSRYGDFAATCARYVERSKGCHIWIIGNEQNNVREHPGGGQNPIEHITPERYAEAFNLARRRIKEVQPEAIVVPGAVDPYNTYPWKRLGGRRNRPLEYFKTMLAHIEDLDGIALHTYTHWLDVNLITAKTVFLDEFLKPGTVLEHYYDFQAYRAFAEAIPARWRDRPIYITETNHWLALEHKPRNQDEERRIGWVNVDRGWVQAAYAEINRWNQTPHAQQIHCLLLYRWTGDAWAIKDKRGVLDDFQKALDHDYRWRR